MTLESRLIEQSACTLASGHLVMLTEISDEWLPLMRDWFDDPELSRLTMAPPIDAASQEKWFQGLAARDDYAIFGITVDGRPTGAMGMRDIGSHDGGEYFLYIVHEEHRGIGLASWSARLIRAYAQMRGLSWVFGRVGKHNERSLGTHLHLGFQVLKDRGDTVWIGLPVGSA